MSSLAAARVRASWRCPSGSGARCRRLPSPAHTAGPAAGRPAPRALCHSNLLAAAADSACLPCRKRRRPAAGGCKSAGAFRQPPSCSTSAALPLPQADGYYYPPNYDPKKGGLNKVRACDTGHSVAEIAVQLRSSRRRRPRLTVPCLCPAPLTLPAVPGLARCAGRPRAQAGQRWHPHHPL